MSARVIVGDCRDVLATLDAESVQTCVTSPPYFGLRDYGVAGQIGLEQTPDEYVAELVTVFREVRRVLRPNGTLWLNLGDSYAGGGGFTPNAPSNVARREKGDHQDGAFAFRVRDQERKTGARTRPGLGGAKPKDLLGIPWRVAFALQADGWWLRSEVIWHKPNPMPESVTDRPTRAHEHVFLLSRAERYHYDADAVREPLATPEARRGTKHGRQAMRGQEAIRARGNLEACDAPAERYYAHGGRNARSVWTIATQPYGGAHFATMPPSLAERCILAGSRHGDTVLDPFAGAGTTLLVADRLGRDGIGVELNPAYAALAADRLRADAPLLVEVRT